MNNTHTGMMTSIDTSRGSLTKGLVESPCLKCEHRDQDKNECLGGEGCFLAYEREPIYFSRPRAGRQKHELYCQFPGCGAVFYTNNDTATMCHRCRMLVHKRKRINWPADRLYEPPRCRTMGRY